MNWHKATEAPKDGAKCLLRVIRDNGKNEIRMGTACVFVNSHFWYDEDENYETWEIKRVKCWCPVEEIECELDKIPDEQFDGRVVLRNVETTSAGTRPRAV